MGNFPCEVGGSFDKEINRRISRVIAGQATTERENNCNQTSPPSINQAMIDYSTESTAVLRSREVDAANASAAIAVSRLVTTIKLDCFDDRMSR